MVKGDVGTLRLVYDFSTQTHIQRLMTTTTATSTIYIAQHASSPLLSLIHWRERVCMRARFLLFTYISRICVLPLLLPDDDELGCFLSIQCRAFVILSYRKFGTKRGDVCCICLFRYIVVGLFLRSIIRSASFGFARCTPHRAFVQLCVVAFASNYSIGNCDLKAIQIARSHVRRMYIAHIIKQRKNIFRRSVFCARLPAGETVQCATTTTTVWK